MLMQFSFVLRHTELFSCFLTVFTKLIYSKILSLFREMMDLRLSCRLYVYGNKGHKLWGVKLRSHCPEVSVTCS